jgi:HEPN domain-containing protein
MTLALGVYHYGLSYHLATEKLRADPTPDRRFPDAPIEFLAVHAVELYLKAMLMAEGDNEDELRDRYGHNLLKMAYQVASKSDGIGPDVISAVNFLWMNRRNIESRYLRAGAHKVLPSSHLCGLLRSLCITTHNRMFEIGAKPRPLPEFNELFGYLASRPQSPENSDDSGAGTN